MIRDFGGCPDTHISTHIPQVSTCKPTYTQKHHLPIQTPCPGTPGNIACQSNPVFLCIHPSVTGPSLSLPPPLHSHLHNLRKLQIANTNSFPWPDSLDHPALPTLLTTPPTTRHLPLLTVSLAKICSTHSTPGPLHSCSLSLKCSSSRSCTGCLRPFL